MLLLHLKTSLATALCVAACSQLVLAQMPPVTILDIEMEKQVLYVHDVFDFSKLASSPNAATIPNVPFPLRTFSSYVSVADIVAVNGRRVKGTHTVRSVALNPKTAPTPGQAIADIARTGMLDWIWEILDLDGRTIGSIMASGLSAGSPPPGMPSVVNGSNAAITGGTGAFLGIRGQAGGATARIAAPLRTASVLEDPANRRIHGGGNSRYILQLIPLVRPEVVTTSTGPAVFHGDFSPVTAAKPAKAGEVLIVKATGLGPTLPGVNLGQPFPLDAIQQVNSPVEVTVNGQAVEVVNSIGWPGLVDTFRVDFRMPDGATAGAAMIQLTAAWIAGPSVNIPIQ